jgi:hypothetical protein
VVRLFCIAFTKRRPDQVRANCYAQSAQIRKIRKKMVEIMTAEASKVLPLQISGNLVLLLLLILFGFAKWSLSHDFPSLQTRCSSESL